MKKWKKLPIVLQGQVLTGVFSKVVVFMIGNNKMTKKDNSWKASPHRCVVKLSPSKNENNGDKTLVQLIFWVLKDP